MAAGLSIACAPFGARFDAAYGLFVGAFDQLTSNIDAETRAELSSRLSEYLSFQSLDLNLMSQIHDQANIHFNVIEDSSANRLDLTIERITLDIKEDNVSLSISVAASLTQWEKTVPLQASDRLYYHSDYYLLSDWLSGDSSFYDELFMRAQNDLSYLIVTSLMQQNY